MYDYDDVGRDYEDLLKQRLVLENRGHHCNYLLDAKLSDWVNE